MPYLMKVYVVGRDKPVYESERPDDVKKQLGRLMNLYRKTNLCLSV